MVQLPPLRAPERRRLHKSTVVAAVVSAAASLGGGGWANASARAAARTEERVRIHTEEIAALSAKLDRIIEAQQAAAVDLAVLARGQGLRLVPAVKR